VAEATIDFALHEQDQGYLERNVSAGFGKPASAPASSADVDGQAWPVVWEDRLRQ